MGRSTRGLGFPGTSSPPSPSRAQDFASPARKAIADPNVELHVNMTGLERFGDFMDAAKRGLLAGEAGHSTDYEMPLIARAVANGQRAWSSAKFYYPRSDGFDWEIGSTGDLGLLLEAVAAWREGIPLDELEERFEFTELDEFVGALERGEPASSQWAELLSSDFHRRQWNILRRLRADEVLRDMFPTISHGAVRLCVNAMDGRSRRVLVDEVNGELYEVMRVGVPGASWVEVPAGDPIAYLRAALNEE
ncbi:hypothetical protein ACIOFV_37335 [Streptomyces mirabilis]|uniref:hypothetical protein n=1 Tax=Streptomyces mirabilis TaxID=68239 RepID=UPI003816C612